jgi:hypothetical protein
MKWCILILVPLFALTPTQSHADCLECRCNGKNYAESELGLCVSECKASMGCYGGICAPLGLPGSAPTAAQTATQTAWFPKLQCFTVLSPEDKSYNCISWSVGSDKTWTWDTVDSVYGDDDGTVEVSDFDAFYKAFAYAPAANCSFEAGKHKVALFVKSSIPQHAARQAIGQPGWWESKEGQAKKSVHKLEELEGGEYGDVIKCYVKAQP